MSHSDKHTLVIVDDHPLFRNGLSHLISTEPKLQLVGEASTGKEGIHLVSQVQPDLLILDLKLKDIDGLAVMDIIKQKNTSSRIVILTVSDDEEDIINVLRLGADGYLLKDYEPKVILDGILKAARGEFIFSDHISQYIIKASLHQNSPSLVDDVKLTPREIETLKFIARGLSNKHIANELGIAEGTVKVHVKNFLKRLCLKSRVEAAVWATKHNLSPN